MGIELSFRKNCHFETHFSEFPPIYFLRVYAFARGGADLPPPPWSYRVKILPFSQPLLLTDILLVPKNNIKGKAVSVPEDSYQRQQVKPCPTPLCNQGVTPNQRG